MVNGLLTIVYCRFTFYFSPYSSFITAKTLAIAILDVNVLLWMDIKQSFSCYGKPYEKTLADAIRAVFYHAMFCHSMFC